MKIVVSGIGETGFYLAQILINEGHDLILIEQDEKHVKRAQENLDAQIIEGDGANSLLLEPLVDETVDIFVALTDNDETNILSTLIARKYGAKRALTRISDTSELIHPLLTDDRRVSVLNAEMATAKDLNRLIGNPAADEIEFFANGKAEMVKFHVGNNSNIHFKKLKDIKMPKGWLFIAVTRRGKFSVLDGESELEPGDQVLMMGDPDRNRDVEELLGLQSFKVRRAILVGYNEITATLAKSLSRKDIEVRVIEEEKDKAERAAAELDRILVIHGDGTSQEILEQAGIDQTDIMLALTNDDETNVLISLLAKEKQVRRVIALAQKPQYKPIIEKIGIDAVINTRTAMVDEIIHSIHHEDLSGISILEGGQGQMMEFVVKEKSKFVDTPLAKLKMPKQSLIGAIVRGDELIIPRGGDKIEVGDRVVVFSARAALREVKKLFTG